VSPSILIGPSAVSGVTNSWPIWDRRRFRDGGGEQHDADTGVERDVRTARGDAERQVEHAGVVGVARDRPRPQPVRQLPDGAHRPDERGAEGRQPDGERHDHVGQVAPRLWLAHRAQPPGEPGPLGVPVVMRRQCPSGRPLGLTPFQLCERSRRGQRPREHGEAEQDDQRRYARDEPGDRDREGGGADGQSGQQPRPRTYAGSGVLLTGCDHMRTM